jgi:hypothetical protein
MGFSGNSLRCIGYVRYHDILSLQDAVNKALPASPTVQPPPPAPSFSGTNSRSSPPSPPARVESILAQDRSAALSMDVEEESASMLPFAPFQAG